MYTRPLPSDSSYITPQDHAPRAVSASECDEHDALPRLSDSQTRSVQRKDRVAGQCKGEAHSLERVRVRLPFTAQLNLDLHAFVNVLVSTLVVHPELQDIAVTQLRRATLRVCR